MDVTCLICNQPDHLYSKKRESNIREDCGFKFTIAESFEKKRVFISYGSEKYSLLALQLSDDLRECILIKEKKAFYKQIFQLIMIINLIDLWIG